MRFLKFLVIFMGVLIVLGISFLIYSIATGLHKKTYFGSTTDSKVSPKSSDNSDHILNNHTVALKDNQIVQSHTVTDNKLIVHVVDQSGKHQQWYVISLETGQQLGNIRFTQTKP